MSYSINHFLAKAYSNPVHFTKTPVGFYWKSYEETGLQLVPVDAVDLRDYGQFLTDHMMTCIDDNLSVFTPPTLLVTKILSMVQRSDSDPILRFHKRETDISDAIFLFEYCISHHETLSPEHLHLLGGQDTMREFMYLGYSGEYPIEHLEWTRILGGMRESWDKLVQNSGLVLEMWKWPDFRSDVWVGLPPIALFTLLTYLTATYGNDIRLAYFYAVINYHIRFILLRVAGGLVD
jgi:hypothetical protein